MLDLNQLRQQKHKIVVLGNHYLIIQSILDFDYLSDKAEPSVIAIIGNYSGFSKYFWGKQEILIPIYSQINSNLLAQNPAKQNTNHWFLNLLSGRRALSTGKELIELFGGLARRSSSGARSVGGVFFAEGVPEKDSLELYYQAKAKDVLLIGPASVGLVMPGCLKLGPIGGITLTQVVESGILKLGSIAVLSVSGGMTNELINLVNLSKQSLSFALSFGGDRFPLLTPEQAFLMAEADSQTKTILYYGELGGEDEYRLIKLKKQGKLTKKTIMHIAGVVAGLFPQSPQFGHAKAKANKELEKALVKREALKRAGFLVTNKFTDLSKLL